MFFIKKLAVFFPKFRFIGNKVSLSTGSWNNIFVEKISNTCYINHELRVVFRVRGEKHPKGRAFPCRVRSGIAGKGVYVKTAR
jgi:uncharacterized protein with von Willebrand factor type A (vWA) domain